MSVRITLTIDDMNTGTQATKEAVAMALERLGKVCVLEVTPIITQEPKQERLWCQPGETGNLRTTDRELLDGQCGCNSRSPLHPQRRSDCLHRRLL